MKYSQRSGPILHFALAAHRAPLHPNPASRAARQRRICAECIATHPKWLSAKAEVAVK